MVVSESDLFDERSVSVYLELLKRWSPFNPKYDRLIRWILWVTWTICILGGVASASASVFNFDVVLFALMLYYIIAIVVILVLDLIIVLPRTTWIPIFTEFLATPVKSEDIINDLTSWANFLIRNHLRTIEHQIIPTMIILWLFGGLVFLIISLLIIFLLAITFAIYYVALKSFFLHAGVLAALLPKRFFYYGFLPLVYFLLTIALSVVLVNVYPFHPINEWSIKLYNIVFYGIILIAIPIPFLFYAKLPVLERRRRGEII